MVALLLFASWCAFGLPVFAVESSSSEWSWKCQYPGKWAFCSLVCDQGCIEGPNGFPGGCGFCKFCDPSARPPPECVVSLEEASRSFNMSSEIVQGQPGKIVNASIVVQDVNSWFESRGPNLPPPITTAVQCAKSCMEHEDMCNAWEFCYSAQGCGEAGECSVVGQASNMTDSCITLGPYGQCTADGRFPPLTCVLKIVDNITKVEIDSEVDGWTSGLISLENLGFEPQTNLTCQF
ncbi:hypothetical protein M9435_004692 [Picochlorum sp. BPE23]|nr:hypothetical protein M9435_004692 [Picochlorum sp. BPE23]